MNLAIIKSVYSPFNRTIVELKLLRVCFTLSERLAFNRTIVELKLQL